MEWWKRNNQRLIQTNLRSSDASLDRQVLIEQLKVLNANVLLMNTGGLVSFYPTELPFHYRSPSLGSGDLTGDMVHLCHEHNIRFIARFDFSKIHESIFAEHPDWAYRSLDNKSVNYNGFVHTCVNGGFQKEKSLAILKETLDRYPIDGVFFNMFGYFTRDYSHNYHGICQCDSCRKMFYDRYGLSLPTQEDPNDPVFNTYQQFKLETVHEMMDNIRNLVKSYGENIAVSTYTDDCVDIIKKESNTEIHRPYPLWEYSASENIQSVEGTWDEKTISNVCINAIGLDYRFQGVPTPQVEIRLIQALANGSGMDFCIIGVFKDYPDRKSLKAVEKIYSYHAENEQYYGNFSILEDVVLIKPGPHPTSWQLDEYLGLYRILKEAHISFRVVEQAAIKPHHLKRCKLIICPDLSNTCTLMDILANSKKPIIWTGSTWKQTQYPDFNALFSIDTAGEVEDARWSYVRNFPQSLFPSLSDTDWSMLDGPVVGLKVLDGSIGCMEQMTVGTFGPPEMCQGNIRSGKYLGAITPDGKRQLFSIGLGKLYKRYGYPEHKYLILDRIKSIVQKPVIELDSNEQIEVVFGSYPEDGPASYILHLINLAGFNGSTFFKSQNLRSLLLRIRLRDDETIVSVESLVSKQNVAYSKEKSTYSLNLDLVDSFEAIVIHCTRK
ncbi:hypothetical protein [Sphaerochaeta sp. S2]|uniref:hypothetical protein n=1 Tax=Sphaerochaeta sp. S2 TaxID=2798868 RepID=UPI0018E9EF60|nr:hypothetical protein [Sphaerochaeta sp. S2]MBJ2357311.1 hypothetical protein [Sphaerochaeta sp. S2]